MKKQAIVLGLCVVFVSMVAFASAEDVYKTKNGKKYHRADCKLVQNRDTQKLSKEEATEKGLKPCGKCFKDDSSAQVTHESTERIASNKKSKKEID